MPFFFEDHELVPAVKRWLIRFKPRFVVVGLDSCVPSVVVFPMLESKVRPSTRNMQESKLEAAGQFLEVGNDLFMDEFDQFRLLSPVP